MFQKAALAAIMQHNLAESRLAIAKLQHDSPTTTILEPQVEHLLEERRTAVRAYQEHLATHPQEAGSAR
jgi:hypothetical protein